MKKIIDLYLPLLNVVGIFLTLWCLTIFNIKPDISRKLSSMSDSSKTHIFQIKYTHEIYKENASKAKSAPSEFVKYIH